MEVTWQDFSHWAHYVNREGWFEGFEKASKEVMKNNAFVLLAFEQYLKTGLGLSDKVVRNHLEHTNFFINEFLLFQGIRTPVTDFSDAGEFSSVFFQSQVKWKNPVKAKGIGTSLKKFYDFLAEAQVITLKELKEVKEEISDGVELGLKIDEMIEDRSDL